MRFLIVILWLLLGFLYYWLWSSSSAACCGNEGLSNTEQIAPAGDSLEEDVSERLTGDGTQDSEDSSAKLSEEEAAAAAKAKADADAEKAIAEAAKNKEVTSVKTTTTAGNRKLTFYFPYGSQSSQYSSGSESDLQELVDAAKAAGKKITVSGHTDSDSSAEFNMSLGKRRADKVRAKVISLGMSGSDVISKSFGETKPIASNATEEGKQKNRRVELIIE